ECAIFWFTGAGAPERGHRLSPFCREGPRAATPRGRRGGCARPTDVCPGRPPGIHAARRGTPRARGHPTRTRRTVPLRRAVTVGGRRGGGRMCPASTTDTTGRGGADAPSARAHASRTEPGAAPAGRPLR